MKRKDIIQELERINKRRHLIINELDNLDRLVNKYTEMLKNTTLRRLETIETQKSFDGTLI